MVVDLIVPEQCLVTITPWERLVSNVHVLVLWPLGWWRKMRFVLPVLIPQSVRIGAGNDESRECDVEGQLSP